MVPISGVTTVASTLGSVGLVAATATREASDGEVWCIVVAAGAGRRFGGAKQFELLAGERVLDRSVAAARAACDGIVVVMPPDATGDDVPPGVVAAPGGPTRSASVRAGLAAVPRSAQVVLVHDAARPLASPELFERVVAAVRAGATAVVPAVEVVDSVRRVGGGPVDRTELRAVQTPQGFAAGALRAAHAGGGDATDDATLVEAAGHRVVLVPGERTNLKLTDPVDLDLAAALLARVDRGGGDSGS